MSKRILGNQEFLVSGFVICEQRRILGNQEFLARRFVICEQTGILGNQQEYWLIFYS